MKLKYFLFLFLTLTIIHQTSSIATIRYVSKTGSSTPPFLSWNDAADSIQKCINICSFGDTVYVANGVYKENLVINTQIFLSGLSMDSTIIDGTGLGSRTIDFISIGHIENFLIYSQTVGSGWAIRSYKLVEVKNCQIVQAGLGIAGISSTIKAENLIMKNITKGFSLSCIADTCNNIIKNCVIILNNNVSKGVEISVGGSHNIQNNIILFTGTNNMESGISVGAPRSIYIENNLISGFNQSIFLIQLLIRDLLKITS